MRGSLRLLQELGREVLAEVCMVDLWSGNEGTVMLMS
jgi:hypothetical protein